MKYNFENQKNKRRKNEIVFVCLALRFHPMLETVQNNNIWQTGNSYLSNTNRPYSGQQTLLNNANPIYSLNNYPNEVIDLTVSSSGAAGVPASTLFYATSDRTHSSPSSAGFPPLFNYLPTGYGHHHHSHLSSNVDENSLLIQNPSLTWNTCLTRFDRFYRGHLIRNKSLYVRLL